MSAMKGIEIWRGGVTSRKRLETQVASLYTLPNGRVSLNFYLDSKGGGSTSVSLSMASESFQQIASVMLRADREAALTAFALAVLETSKP